MAVYLRLFDTELQYNNARSNDYYDVAALAKKFGGGGHIHAAGCRFYTDEDDARRQILQALEGDFDAG